MTEKLFTGTLNHNQKKKKKKKKKKNFCKTDNFQMKNYDIFLFLLKTSTHRLCFSAKKINKKMYQLLNPSFTI